MKPRYLCVLAALAIAGCFQQPVPCKQYLQLRTALGALPGFASVSVTPITTDWKKSSFSATIVHDGLSEKELMASVRKHLAAKCPWFVFKSSTPYGFPHKGYYYDVWFIYRAEAMEVRVHQSFSR